MKFADTFFKAFYFALFCYVFLFLSCTTKKAPPPKSAEPFVCNIKKIDSTYNGYYLLAPYEIYYWRFGQIMIMDHLSRIVFERQMHGPVFDFRQWRIKGRTFYTCICNDPEVYHVPKINLAAGYVVLFDSAMHEIRQIRLLPHDDIQTTRHEGLDLHDFLLLSPDHYYTLCAYEKVATNISDSLHPASGTKIVAPVIQEIDHDRVVWQWDGSRYPEFYAASTDQNHFGSRGVVHNYMHINALVIDPRDSNLVVSFRNTNQIVKINRKTGSIIWRLGGNTSDFPLQADQYFYRQHHVQIIDSNHTLLLFDNGDSAKRQSSRILEFNLDEQNKQVTGFRPVNIPKPYSQYMGSVEKIGDNYFICGGSSFYVLEMNSNTGQIRMEMDNNQAIYRMHTAREIDSSLFLYKKL